MQTKTMAPEQIKEQLSQFYGTQNYYRHSTPIGALIHTDGVHFLRREAKCCWLLDLIVSYQPMFGFHLFQHWKVKKDDDNNLVVHAEDGNGNLLVATQILFSDFPLEEVSLYLENGVLILPTEH